MAISPIYLINNVHDHKLIMLENSWSIKLSQEPQVALVVNLPEASIIYRGDSNQLRVYSSGQCQSLPLTKEILALGSAHLQSHTPWVLLLTRYQLSCIDLSSNNQIFNLQFQNAHGMHASSNFIFVLCSADVFCYNLQGEEQYVAHFSTTIEAMAVLSETKHGKEVHPPELLLCLADLSLLRSRANQITMNYGKTVGVAASVAALKEGVLVGTQEGIVSYYEGKKSKWRAKSTLPVLAVLAYEGLSTIAMVARKDGQIEIKDWLSKGETIHKVKIGEQLITLCLFDFRSESNKQLICILKSGSVKAFNIVEMQNERKGDKVAQQVKAESDRIEQLVQEKVQLEFEIARLKEEAEKSEGGEKQGPPLSFASVLNHEKNGLTLRVSVAGGYISGLIFETAIKPLTIEKSTQLVYIFEDQVVTGGQIICWLLLHTSFTQKVATVRLLKVTLPKFWKWTLLSKGKNQGEIKNAPCRLRFQITERNARYLKWINQCFFLALTQKERIEMESIIPLRLLFINSYNQMELAFIFNSRQGSVELQCHCLKTLGELFQDLVEYMGLKELDSQLEFPQQKQRLKGILNKIQELSVAKVSTSSEMAEAVESIKFLLVKGESARMVGSMADFRKAHVEVMDCNRKLLVEIEKKHASTRMLAQALKSLGLMINQTASVRFGKPKETVVTKCREAIKRKEFPSILDIMERGGGVEMR